MPDPALGWGKIGDHGSFVHSVRDNVSKGQYVFSMACEDDFGFGVFTMEYFGTTQIVTWGSDMSNVQIWYDKGYSITACGARHSTFYFIMTHGAEGYDGQNQTWTTKDSWDEAKEYIDQKLDEGMMLTGICYSTGKKQYFLVMTESLSDQIYQIYDWGTTSQAVDHDQAMTSRGFSKPSRVG